MSGYVCLPDVTKKAKEIPKGTNRRPRETSVFDRVLSFDLPYRICQEPSATTFHPFSLSLIFQSLEFFFSSCFYSSSCPCRPTYSSEECDREMCESERGYIARKNWETNTVELTRSLEAIDGGVPRVYAVVTCRASLATVFSFPRASCDLSVSPLS